MKENPRMWASFDRFEIRIALDDAMYVSQPGCDASPYIDDLLGYGDKEIGAQLDKIGPDKIREELSEYGAWDADDLSDDDENRARILWIAGGNIREECHGKPTPEERNATARAHGRNRRNRNRRRRGW
jgi:hypothetical protein